MTAAQMVARLAALEALAHRAGVFPTTYIVKGDD